MSLPEPLHSSLARAWGLSNAQAAGLVRQGTARDVRRGELVARRGMPLPGVFLVGLGIIKLSLCAAEGDERVLRVVGAGDTFGEPTALLGKPCLYDASALTEAKLVTIPTAAIFALIDSDRRFARRLVMVLAARSFGILAEFEAATTQRGAQRLAGYLESLAGRSAARGVCSVQLPVSKTVVAALLGMKKETLSRLLHQLTAEGIIGVARREIAILDRERLTAAARQSA